MARLQITLLGGVEARLRSGQVLSLPGQTVPALVAYLTAQPGRWHTREQLCALLWPEVQATQARHRLRQTLLMTRRALRRVDEGWLLNHGEAVAINPDRVDVDTVAFEQAVAEGTPEALARAVGLYRGDLLAGLGRQAGPFEEWLLSERERLRELGLEALGRLLAQQLRAGLDAQAVHTATRLLALDPTQEAVHRALIRLYAGQGRRGAALQQYQSCLAAVRRELGVEPEPETRQLYQTVLREGPESHGSGVHREVARTAVPEAESLLGGDEIPLVGREAERSLLLRDLEAAWSGGGWTVILRGESGSGKSRLAAEAVRDALDRDGRVMVGRGHETQQILPFGVWIEALRTAGVPDTVGREIPVTLPVRRELARLFPELGRAPVPTSGDHGRLFEALAFLFVEFARRQPLLVVVEDLHWADEMSVRFLAFVSRRLRGHRVLILATVRDEELPVAPVLQSALQEFQGESRATVVRLGPLPREDVDGLVAALARSSVPSDRTRLVERLWRVSEGNPFVLVELVRVIGDLVAPDDGRALPLPERVRDAIAHRLGRLGERERHVLGAAAVIGRDAGFRLIRAVAGLTEPDVAEAAEQLVARGVLHAVGDHLDFVHDRVRAVAYARLLPSYRIALHEAAGRALEDFHAGHLDQVADRLAFHYSNAGQAEKAVAYLVSVGDKLARAYAHAEATAALRNARVLLPGVSAGRQRDRTCVDVAVRLAHAEYFLGRFREGVDVLLEEQQRVSSLGDPSLAAPYHFWLSFLFTRLNEHDRAVESARQAVAEAEKCADVATMGKAYGVLGVEAYWASDCQHAVEHARRGVTLLEDTDERWWLGFGYFNLGMTYLHMGLLEEALEAEARVQTIAEELGDPRLESYGIGVTGWIHAVRGDGEIAVEEVRRALAIAPDLVARTYGTAVLGHAYVEQDDHAQAIPLLEEAVERAGRIGNRQLEGWWTAVLAEAYRLAGRAEQARAASLRALQLSRESGNRHAVGWAQRTLGRIARGEGAVPEALAALTDALETFEAADARFEAARTRLDLGELAAGRGDVAASASQLRGAAEMFQILRVPRYIERTAMLAARHGISLAPS
jgi:DNA-binding SARP family transcriptional activator